MSIIASYHMVVAYVISFQKYSPSLLLPLLLITLVDFELLVCTLVVLDNIIYW